jgi:hypothetical protein
MNYAESFEQFSNRLTPTDLMVYGGVALVLFVLFQDKLNPLKNWLINLYNNISSKLKDKNSIVSKPSVNNDSDFLRLVSSWKTTRDMAEAMGRIEAVKLLDSAFPYLGPKDNGEES